MATPPAPAPAPAPAPTENLFFDDDELIQWSAIPNEGQPILENIIREYYTNFDEEISMDYMLMKLREHINSITVEKQRELKENLKQLREDPNFHMMGAKKSRRSRSRKSKKSKKSRKSKKSKKSKKTKRSKKYKSKN